jgi:hypothetical protein
MAAFCNSMPGLWTRKLIKCEANSPKVSRHHREYSRSPETDGGDKVRSALVAGLYSANSPTLRPAQRETGNSERALRAEDGSFKYLGGCKDRGTL